MFNELREINVQLNICIVKYTGDVVLKYVVLNSCFVESVDIAQTTLVEMQG